LSGEPRYLIQVVDQVLREMGCESVSDPDDPTRRGWLNRGELTRSGRARIGAYKLSTHWPHVPESDLVELLRSLGLLDRFAECVRRLNESGGRSLDP